MTGSAGRLWRARWQILFGILILVGFTGTYVGWTLRDMPDPGHDDVLKGTVTVLDRRGQVIEERNAQGEFHITLHLDQMGKYAPAATLAAEDRSFYKHGAISFTGLLRAILTDVQTGSYTEGGSTITQQLVKLELLTPQKSIFRKIQEAVLAVGLEARYSKDQILEMYLNRVYYGHGAYGIGAASQTYFGKDAKDLTPAEAAYLAGLIQAPAYYDPVAHPDAAKARQLYVLQGMVVTGVLTSDQATTAAHEQINASVHSDVRTSRAPHFVDYVIGQAEKALGPNLVQRGMTIHTTLDPDLQKLAQSSVQDGVTDLRYHNVNNGMMLAARPTTGEILAWVGSVDYNDDAIAGQFDYVADGQRQPGSSFKVFTYEAALKDHKITVGSTLPDTNPSPPFPGFPPNWPPDWDNRRMGNISMRTALVQSRNMPAVFVGQKEGIGSVTQLARDMGITTKIAPDLQAAFGEGQTQVKMIDMVQAYSVFADQGTKVPLYAITEIDDPSGDLLYKAPTGNQTQVLSPAESYLITDVIKDYARTWGLGWQRQMAAKSGTPAGATISDAWIFAYNPSIVIGAWGGHTSQDPNASQPITAFSTDVGRTMMKEFINGMPSSYGGWYTQPDGITTASGCPGVSSGHEIFLTGTENDPICNLAPSPTPSPSPSPTVTPIGPTATPTPTPGPIPTLIPRGPTPTPGAGP